MDLNQSNHSYARNERNLSMSEAVISRPRRRRPPNHRERIAIALCAVAMLGMFTTVFGVSIMRGEMPALLLPLNALALMLDWAMLWLFWPTVVNYIRNGYV